MVKRRFEIDVGSLEDLPGMVMTEDQQAGNLLMPKLY